MSLIETTPALPGVERGQAEVAAPQATARTCAACGTGLEHDQLACLECGQIVRPRRRLIPTGWPRRAGLASATALLVSMCAGLGVSAAFEGGGKLPKTVASAQKPGAGANPSIAIPPKPAAPASAAPAGSKPAASGPNAASPAGAGTPGSAGGGTGGTASSSSPSATGTGTGSPSTAEAHPGGGTPSPFAQIGQSPSSAYVLSGSDSANSPNNAVDGNAQTFWRTASVGPGALSHPIGLGLDAGSSTAFKKLGILVHGNSGFTAEIYGATTNGEPSSPPTQPGSGWQRLSGPTPVSGQQEISLNSLSSAPRYYLIWITSLQSSDAEIADVALIW